MLKFKSFFTAKEIIHKTKTHTTKWEKTFENYLAAKQRLFEHTKKDGVCIINNDDLHAKDIISKCNGKVITYGTIANKIAKQKGITKMSAQAVGGAVGHNPISIIIPCHRVIGSNGNLTGYAGGIDKKVFLLKHANTDMTNLFIPQKSTARV